MTKGKVICATLQAKGHGDMKFVGRLYTILHTKS